MTISEITPAGPITIRVGERFLFSDDTPDGFWTTDDVTVAVPDQTGAVFGIAAGQTVLKYWIGEDFTTCQIVVE